jgi:hypothetical protein
MITLVELLYREISETQPYRSVYQLIAEKLNGTDKELFRKAYNEHFNGKDVNESFSLVRRRKWRRKKKLWYERAVEGFKYYQKTGEIKRGIYRHLVNDYLFLKQVWDKNPSYFSKTFKFANVDAAIQDRMEMLRKWCESDESYLVHYLYFSDFSPQSRTKALMVDMAIIQGKWLLEHEEVINHAKLENGELWVEEPEKTEPQEGAMVISQAPYTAMQYPMIGVSNRRRYQIDKENVIEMDDQTLVQLKPHSNFEISGDYQLFLNLRAKQIQETHVRTLDSRDWVIFLEICNRRDINFQRNRWIKVYLADLVESVYQSDSGWAYQDLIERLFRMRDFTVVQRNGDKIGIRSFFTDLVFNKDLDGREYVIAYVGPLIFNNIIKEEMIYVYGKETEELKITNPLAHHLSFVVQKIRMLSHPVDPKDYNKDIQFDLTWDDLTVSLRMNKKTKRENLDDIEQALSDIKKKRFLVKDFKRYNKGFKVVCYPLKDYELQDMRRVKLSLDSGTRNLLSVTAGPE